MAELKARREAYRTTVVYQLGCAAGAGTTETDDGADTGSARLGIRIDEWLVDDSDAGPHGAGERRGAMEICGACAGGARGRRCPSWRSPSLCSFAVPYQSTPRIASPCSPGPSGRV
jgi:hypothetical protein